MALPKSAMIRRRRMIPKKLAEHTRPNWVWLCGKYLHGRGGVSSIVMVMGVAGDRVAEFNRRIRADFPNNAAFSRLPTVPNRSGGRDAFLDAMDDTLRRRLHPRPRDPHGRLGPRRPSRRTDLDLQRRAGTRRLSSPRRPRPRLLHGRRNPPRHHPARRPPQLPIRRRSRPPRQRHVLQNLRPPHHRQRSGQQPANRFAAGVTHRVPLAGGQKRAMATTFGFSA